MKTYNQGVEYICAACTRRYPVAEQRYRCACGGYLELHSSSVFSKEAVASRGPSLWRYREAYDLPEAAEAVTLGEGRTPLLQRTVRGRTVSLKLDYLQPSGSFKDRGASVLLTLVKHIGAKEIVEDSSGNAGAAMAAYAASAGIACTIYTPDYTPDGKLVQIRHYGAEVVKVAGTRQDANDAVLRAAERSFYASHLWNPYFVAGLQSCAFELWEQRGGEPPEVVVLPLGSGGYLEGLHAGFSRLRQAGYTKRTPRLVGVQADGCPPLHEAFEKGLETYADVKITSTLAEGIVVQRPPRAPAVLRALRESEGRTVCVDDEAILDAMRTLFRMGVYVEPTSAAAFAGYLSLPAAESSEAVVILTGSGLKETAKLKELVE